MNIKHSNKSVKWYTPVSIVESAREILGVFDLDPASDEFGNSRVKAIRYFTEQDNGLKQVWHNGASATSIILNPPGSKLGNKSMPVLFWQKLLDLRNNQWLHDAIFIGFNMEIMQTSQSCKESVLDFPFCIPKNRLKFDLQPEDLAARVLEGKSNSPSHANIIVYVPGIVDRTEQFAEEFKKYGQIVIP